MTYYGGRRRSGRPPSSPHWMDLRYAGTCYICSADLPKGTRAFWDPRDRTITCTNIECCKAAGLTEAKMLTFGSREMTEVRTATRWIPEDRGHVVVTRFAGGGVHYRNSRGRCEDAPCCGCCS